MINIKNKKGDIASIIFVVIFVFTIGVFLFFLSDINYRLFDELNNSLTETNMNTTYTSEAIDDFARTNNSVWDYAFLGIFLGSLIAIGLSAYAIRISPIFYWVYGVMSLVVLAAGAMLSNIWQDLSRDAEFATTLSRFPIMDSILGTYFPLAITAVIVVAMIIIFGKPPGQQEGYY